VNVATQSIVDALLDRQPVKIHQCQCHVIGRLQVVHEYVFEAVPVLFPSVRYLLEVVPVLLPSVRYVLEAGPVLFPSVDVLGMVLGLILNVKYVLETVPVLFASVRCVLETVLVLSLCSTPC